MENVWERFDDIAKPEDVMQAKASFKPIEPGVYEVMLEHIEAGLTRTGLPMLKTRFRLVESNQVLFSNINLQVIGYQNLTDENIANAHRLIEGLIDEEFDFVGLKHLAEMIPNIPINTKHQIKVSYRNNDHEKNFPEVEVVEPAKEIVTDDVNIGWGATDVDSEDIPF